MLYHENIANAHLDTVAVAQTVLTAPLTFIQIYDIILIVLYPLNNSTNYKMLRKEQALCQ